MICTDCIVIDDAVKACTAPPEMDTVQPCWSADTRTDRSGYVVWTVTGQGGLGVQWRVE